MPMPDPAPERPPPAVGMPLARVAAQRAQRARSPLVMEPTTVALCRRPIWAARAWRAVVGRSPGGGGTPMRQEPHTVRLRKQWSPHALQTQSPGLNARPEEIMTGSPDEDVRPAEREWAPMGRKPPTSGLVGSPGTPPNVTPPLGRCPTPDPAREPAAEGALEWR